MSERCKKHALVSFDGCELCQLDGLLEQVRTSNVRIAELEAALREIESPYTTGSEKEDIARKALEAAHHHPDCNYWVWDYCSCPKALEGGT